MDLYDDLFKTKKEKQNKTNRSEKKSYHPIVFHVSQFRAVVQRDTAYSQNKKQKYFPPRMSEESTTTNKLVCILYLYRRRQKCLGAKKNKTKQHRFKRCRFYGYVQYGDDNRNFLSVLYLTRCSRRSHQPRCKCSYYQVYYAVLRLIINSVDTF